MMDKFERGHLIEKLIRACTKTETIKKRFVIDSETEKLSEVQVDWVKHRNLTNVILKMLEKLDPNKTYFIIVNPTACTRSIEYGTESGAVLRDYDTIETSITINEL